MVIIRRCHICKREFDAFRDEQCCPECVKRFAMPNPERLARLSEEELEFERSLEHLEL